MTSSEHCLQINQIKNLKSVLFLYIHIRLLKFDKIFEISTLSILNIKEEVHS